MHRIFVYGTLRKGHRNHERFMQTAQLIGYAETRGMMVSLGGFPGVKFNEESPGRIIGEVYDVDTETLRRLDMLEGYDPKRKEMNMYSRVKVTVKGGDSEPMEVESYEYNGGMDPHYVIRSGDFNKDGRR